jgi:hypothetical protein
MSHDLRPVITAYAYIEELRFTDDSDSLIYTIPGSSFIVSGVHVPRNDYGFGDHLVFRFQSIDVPLVLNFFLFKLSPSYSALQQSLDPPVLVSGGITVTRNFTGIFSFCLSGRLYR